MAFSKKYSFTAALFTANFKRKQRNKRHLIDVVCCRSRLGLMFPGSGIHQSEDMINGANSDPCSYLLSSECVPFLIDTHRRRWRL